MLQKFQKKFFGIEGNSFILRASLSFNVDRFQLKMFPLKVAKISMNFQPHLLLSIASLFWKLSLVACTTVA